MSRILTRADVQRLRLDKKQHISAADLQGYDEIGGEAFAQTNVVTVEIPENITTIGSKCFVYCNKLEEVFLHKGLKIIGERCFGSSSIERIAIPSSVETVPLGCFADCQKLKEVTLYDGLKYIATDAFAFCTMLHPVEIPSSVERIGQNAFHCSGLSEIVFHEGLKIINSYAFAGTQLKEVVFPSTVETIVRNAFSHNVELKQVDLSKCKMERLDDYVFENCDALEEVKLPETIKYIGIQAFYNCPLKKFNFPDALETINPLAFYNAHLTEIALGKNLYDISASAFSSCSYVEKITVDKHCKFYASDDADCIVELAKMRLVRGCKNTVVPANVKSISADAFTGVTIDKLYIPAGVTSIDTLIFDTTYLKDVEVDKNNPVYSDEGCHCIINKKNQSLVIASETAIIPKTVKKIETCAFARTHFEQIVVPENICYIGAGAFSNIETLETVVIEGKDVTIGKHAFINDYNLKSVRATGVSSIEEDAFLFCTELQNVDINGTDDLIIHSDAFSKCFKLKHIDIKNAKGICIGAFGHGTLGKEKFSNMKKLDNVVAYKAFDKCNNGRKEDGCIYSKYGFEYKEGMTYTIEGHIEICRRGFHACLNPLEVFCYYAGELEDLEFHKVVLNDAYDTEGTTSKVCAAQITIGEKLTFEELLQEYNRLHEND